MTLLHVLVPLFALFALLIHGFTTGRFETPFWLLMMMFVATYPLALPLLHLLSPDDTNVDGWLPWAMRLALGPLAALCVSPLFALTRERRKRKAASKASAGPSSSL